MSVPESLAVAMLDSLRIEAMLSSRFLFAMLGSWNRKSGLEASSRADWMLSGAMLYSNTLGVAEEVNETSVGVEVK
jgi:hypothetical protein